MIHPISADTCAKAWLGAISLLGDAEHRCAYNVILDIENPISLAFIDKRIVQALDELLVAHDAQPVATVAGTIFPAAHYRQRGLKGVMEDFPKRVYPKVKKNWGTYAGRMLVRTNHTGQELNPLQILIDKLRQQMRGSGPKRAIYEVNMVDVFADLPIYDPGRDARRVMNQPCLAHLSFKLTGDHGLMLTALYRNHYYVERALGNLIGLSQLLFFVAKEAELEPKGLVCHSTFARLDFDGGWTVREVNRLIEKCKELVSGAETSSAVMNKLATSDATKDCGLHV
ncbi:MAG: hypothetical protein SFV18_16320 [Bryobacteraceae bacterium]|nr:hypothetical protein [Bryobacteraceae bacterium]